jgi:3-hydroxyacyl-CoA dehydrogenase
MIVRIERDGDIAVVTINNPPVNALSQELRHELWKAVGTVDADSSVRAAVLICTGRTFIAGADVTEFGKPPVPPHLPGLVERLEASAKPWVAAIHGSALGGGFEVAMGCRFRVALKGASLGLPEVTLGIVPGASGTVRTVRLAGVEAAVRLVTTGRPVKADTALSLGLVDAVVTGDLRAETLVFTRKILTKPLPKPISARPVVSPEAAWWEDQRKTITKRARGEVAPLRALDCLRVAAERPFAEAMAFERATFLDLRASDQAAALRHIFFAERAALRPAHLADTKPRPILSASVIGGGTMGAGIAAALLDAGLPVILIERDAEAVERALSNLRSIFGSAVNRGKLTETQAKARIERVTAGSDYALLANTELVIEAVFEDLSVKRAVFTQLGQICRPDAILATNTSYLDPCLIAEGLPKPERFIGLHFFSPANVMRLLEIVPTPKTSLETLATGFALARYLEKIPIQSGICDGFIGNRILKRYRAEAEALVRQGTSIAAIDSAMRRYGFAMGPFEAQDLGGLDIAYLQREGARAAGQEVPETLGDILIRAGRKGQKTGGGWYDYIPGDRRPKPSDTTTRLLADSVTAGPDYSPEAIATLLTGSMAEEGWALISEGIARKPSDIDLVEVHGYGYPRWRGGPMYALE